MDKETESKVNDRPNESSEMNINDNDKVESEKVFSEKDGLLANAKEETKKNSDEKDSSEDLTTTSLPDESAPVDAPERPDYIPENFWDVKKGEVNIKALAKSYSELRKKFNEKNNDKTPENIEDYFDEKYYTEDGMLKSDKIEISKDDPALKAAYEIAKNSGMGIKQTNDFINGFIENMADYLPQKISVEDEIKKLGNNGEKLVSGLKVWVDSMLKNGEVSEEVYQEMLALGKTAAGVKALDVLRQKSGELTLPVGEALSGSTHMTLDDWYNATYETHAEPGESRMAFEERMHELGKKLIGKGYGTYNGSGRGIKLQKSI